MMYELSPPGRRRPPDVVAIPGPAVPIEGPCACCGTCADTFVKRVIDRRDVTVCADAAGCRDRVTLRALDGPL